MAGVAGRAPPDRPRVWVVTCKKTSGGPHVSYDDIVDEAIAHGWVDSRPASLDAARSQILVTPRQPTSNWSRVNQQRVARLTAAGRMTRPAKPSSTAPRTTARGPRSTPSRTSKNPTTCARH